MNPKELADALAGARHEFTDLGDGTGVLASLESGRMITLNELATSVVRTLLGAAGADPRPALDALADDVARGRDVERSQVAADIDAFLATLAAALDGN